MSTDTTDLRRVTVTGVHSSFDVALPAGVPLAYLLPTLLRQAGEELADAGVGHGGWALQRLGAWPFDTGQSAAALGITDGEVLYLRPRQQELPPPVFDDAVEAIGWTLAERTHRWDTAATRTAALVALGAVLALGAGLTLLAGPPYQMSASAAGLGCVLLLIAATAMSRALGNAAVAALLGCAAVPYAFLAGLLGMLGAEGLPGVRAPAVLVGASAALVALVVAAAGVGGGESVFLGAGLVTAVVFFTSLAAGHTSAGGAAAVALGLAFLAAPAIPATAYRLARLPAPFLPTSAEQLRHAETTLPGARLSERALVADRHVTALLAGCALLTGGATPLLATAGGWAPSALAGVAALLALLRLRLFTGRTQRAWLLGAALVTAAGAVATLTAHLPNRPARAVLVLAVLLAALAVAGLAARPERPASPPRARLLDIVEIVVAIATIPLVLEVLGVYTYVRSLGG